MAIWTEWPITSHRQTLVNNQLKKLCHHLLSMNRARS